MPRCRFRSFSPVLLAVQFASFIIITYLLRENYILKQSLSRNNINGKRNLQRTITKYTLKENINVSATSLRTKTIIDWMGKIGISAGIPSRFKMRSAWKSTRLNKDDLKLKKDTYSKSRIEKLPTKRPRKFAPSMLTIVVFSSFGKNFKINTLENVMRLYPTLPLIVKANKKESLGEMISRVKTEYFLVLEEGVMLSERQDENIQWLWDALERFPEIDFIGGSYLTGDKLRVQCHHYRLCNWTFSVSYEYERSLGNVMICDGTSSSFMGRRESLSKIHGFDSGIHDMMVINDFFLQGKRSNVVVGTLPNVIFLFNNFSSLYELWQTQDITQALSWFAVKHKVFVLKDNDGNTIDLCSPESPLRGKYLCREKIAHKLMLEGVHWAYKGVFAYPYMLRYLKVTLFEVIKFFEEHNVEYDVYGGVMLGAIKMRSILPWEAGDIDINVYGMSVVQLRKLLEPWTRENGYIIRTHNSEAVHIFCTPLGVGTVSGGLATIVTHASESAPDFVKIKTHGIWVRYQRDFYKFFKKHYSENYLQHKVYRRKNVVECKITGHNACLPNFKSMHQGRAGTLKDYYCRS